jgi:hypothetical protein
MHHKPSRRLRRTIILTCLVMGNAQFAMSQYGNVQPTDNDLGYFPTYQESGQLATRDVDYGRSSGGPLGGPDLDRLQTTGGLWPVEQRVGPIADIHRAIDPVDDWLRPFVPGETLVIQGPTSESWLQLGGSFPFMTRTYHSDRSTLASIIGLDAMEYSPFFFDILSVSAIAMNVEGSGSGFEAAGLNDGFLAALSIDLRLGWRLTEQTTLAMGGQVYFVFSDDADAQFFLDAGGMSALAELNIQEEFGAWDLRFFDTLRPFSQRNLFYNETLRGEIVQSGHRYVGLPTNIEPVGFWDSRAHYLANDLGFTAGRFLGEDWRFMAGLGRTDLWQWNNFGQHANREYATAGLFYNGYAWWMAPSLTYTMQSQDFANSQHQLMLNGTAPITQNLTLNVGTGYSWGEFYDGMQWNGSLRHQLGTHFSHSVTYFSGYQDVLIGEDMIGNRWDYALNYQIGNRLTLGLYTSLYDGNDPLPDSHVVGASATLLLGSYTSLRLLSGLTDVDHHTTAGSGETWLHSAMLTHMIAQRTSLSLGYEFIDSGPGQFKEGISTLRMTRTF